MSNKFKVYFLDPLKNEKFTSIDEFNNLDDCYKFILNDIESLLEQQTKFISGLKGNLKTHLEKYKKYLINNNLVYFYGEYNEITYNNEYVYKYWIE